ncbi:hypothetical protein PIIN_11359 [Serendipita indica DSM 11827]|uniref:Uncharacterized protein n=1 Tax=Serendipita indica (strain DSM 11827) TaxID=1109443 RepID=G4U1D9_SERID|nr:hypothetical protein PIIN_11359 [Serendipita indica DSM 11827]
MFEEAVKSRASAGDIHHPPKFSTGSP